MRKRIFTSTVAALALFVVVGLVAALAPSITSLNLARAHSPGEAALTALTVTATADGTAQTLTPAFSSTVYSYTVHVDNSVAQITIEGTPDGDGTVAYQNMDGTTLTDADSGTDGHQVNLPTLGRKLINVVVSHTDSGTTATQTYTVRVIREGTVATDRAALMALYNSTGGANWTNQDQLGEHCAPQHVVWRHHGHQRPCHKCEPYSTQFGWDPAGRIRQPLQNKGSVPVPV